MANPSEKFPMPTPEKPPEEKEKIATINLINEDKELRGQYFEIREKLEQEEVSSKERKKLTERAKAINKELKPIVKELNTKSADLYSKIMDIPVKKKKEWSDEQWNQKIEKNKKVLEETEKKLEEMKDTDPNIKNYLKERITQKREELLKAAIPSKEEVVPEKRLEVEEKKEIKPEEKIEKEKSREELEKELNEKRELYFQTSKDAKIKGEKIFKLKGFKKEAYDKTLEILRKYIEMGDSQRLVSEEKEEQAKAQERKEKFIEELRETPELKQKKIKISEKQAEAIYEAELKKAEYKKVKRELSEKLKIEGMSLGKIYDLVVVKEEDLFQKAKVERGSATEKNIFRRGLEKWMRLGTGKRILYSTLLLGGVGAAASVVGVAGASVFTAALISPGRALRIGGAIVAGKTVGFTFEGARKVLSKVFKTKEKREAILNQLRAEFNINNLGQIEEKRQKLFERWRKRERNIKLAKGILMATAGVGGAIGVGWVEASPAAEAPVEALPQPSTPTPEELKARFPWLKYEEVVEKAKAELREAVESAPVKISSIETAGKDDSIWRMAERQLEARYGEKFTALNEARKTYLIDAIKDKIAENPAKFGLEDIDTIKVGQKVDFASIFEDKAEIDKAFVRADVLTESQIKNIEHNNEILKNWLEAHPDQRLTSERVEEILTKGKVAPPPEVMPKVEPTEGVPPYAEEVPLIEALPEVIKIMDANEIAHLKTIGFTEGEYLVIKDLKVGELLKQIPPDRDEAWAIFGGQVPDKSMDLPHHGIYGASEFKRHLKLAELIRSFKPGPAVQEMPIREFLRMVGPDGSIIM